MSASATSDDLTPLTAREVLCPDPDAIRATVAAALEGGGLADSLPEAGSDASRFVVEQAAAALDAILDELELGELLMGAWQQVEEVRLLIEETRLDGSTRKLTLVSHTVTSEHRPSLELVVNKVPKRLLDLCITLGFTIAVCDLVVSQGAVTGVELGPLTAQGSVTAQGYTVVERETSDLDPARLFGAHRPSIATPVPLGGPA